MQKLQFRSSHPSRFHKPHFEFCTFLFPSQKGMGQRSYRERVPEMDFLTLVPQFSAQRCDRLGCHLVYFLQHNHSSGMGSLG